MSAQTYLLALITVALIAGVAVGVTCLWDRITSRFIRWLFKGAAFFMILVGAHTTFQSITYAEPDFIAARNQGIRLMWGAFDNLPPTPDLYHKVIIPRTELIVVGHRSKFVWNFANNPENRVTGYTSIWAPSQFRNTTTQIYILGKKYNGGIMLPTETLGHEVQHILQFYESEIFLNPDTLRMEK